MSMNVKERIKVITGLFTKLEANSSRIDKTNIINFCLSNYGEHPEHKDDLIYCFEVLAGMHKIGFKLDIPDTIGDEPAGFCIPEVSLRDFCKPLETLDNHSIAWIQRIEKQYIGFGEFLNPLFNREWKLGIGPSLLPKASISPMLAKKFDPDKIPDDETYYLTEKIDGNRCIAKYSNSRQQWEFWSRSGKTLKLNLDMGNLSKEYIWDGELVSREQYERPSQAGFNTTSGNINSKYQAKTGLIYLIFDIMDNSAYKDRRWFISEILGAYEGNTVSDNVKILPVLAVCTKDSLVATVEEHLDKIVSKGGEGVMINLGSRNYVNKRTDGLLKVKNTYTMDMRVLSVLPGTGKYTDQVGSLECFAKGADQTKYFCNVGSGLKAYQSARWTAHPEEIIGKIVEVAYFSTSQSKKLAGTTQYSLRFPRLKRVRDDKKSTSVD